MDGIFYILLQAVCLLYLSYRKEDTDAMDGSVQRYLGLSLGLQ